MKLCVLLLAALAVCCEGKFVAHSQATELTPSTFKKDVIDGDHLWIIVFYAPWCGHCKALASEWEKLAKAVAPSIRVGALNADEHKEIAGQYQVQGFPTIKLFGSDKKSPKDYNGARTASALAQAAIQLLQSKISDTLGGGSRPPPKSSGGGENSGKQFAVMLTTSEFDSKVIDSSDEWLIQFMAPWCGHCQRLKPEWEEAAKKLAGDYKLGIVDATQESALAQRYDIKSYPTIKHFKRGADGRKEAGDYNGGRVAQDIVQYVEAHLDRVGAMAPVPEIVKPEVFREHCDPERSGVLCVVAFLPHILDDRAAARQARLEKLAEARRKVGRTFRFMWVVGGENADIEDRLGLGFGFPAVVALSPAKQRFSVMRQAFSADNLAAFLQSVLRGKERTSELRGPPLAFHAVAAWDGKDPPEPEPELDD